jgi:hypothetical protein
MSKMERSELIEELAKYPPNTPILVKDKDLVVNSYGTVKSVLEKIIIDKDLIIKINDLPVTRVGVIEFEADNEADNLVILILQNDTEEDYCEKEDNIWLARFRDEIVRINNTDEEFKNSEEAVNFLIDFLNR